MLATFENDRAAPHRAHPQSPRFDSAAGAGQLFLARESLMSHAEYAPKRLPVLTRLAMALRQIPAVEFALAKFKTLLRARTNEEPGVAIALLPPASDVVNENASAAIAGEPVETDTTTGDCTETVAPVIAVLGSDIRTDESGTLVVADVEVPEMQAEAVEAHGAATDLVAPAPVEIDAAETPNVEVETIAEDSEETSLASEHKTELAETNGPAAVDAIGIAAVQAPASAAEPIEIEIPAPGTAIDTLEAPALGAEDISSASASPDDHMAQEPASLAAVPELEITVAKPDAHSEREALIRRRWKETGIMMWRGAGQSILCIQGSAALLPPKPGETMPQYDRLEFRLVDGLIVCEGFVVEPPAPLKAPFARAA